MPITTSNGEYFEDAYEQAHTQMFGAKGTYDPKTDTFVADEIPEPKEIYFVRHGDTDLNKEGETSTDRAPVRGWSDTPLNAQGRADAEKAAEKLHKEPITHIVSSDLPRASETAEIIGKKLGITPEYNPGLRTWDLGDYTGQTGKETHDAVDNLCLHAPDTQPPGGESFNEFKSRILTTFGQIAQDHREHEVLVVSHNSPERVLNAYDQENGTFDSKSYHSDEGSVDPGQHKKFTIKDPSQLAQTFEDRWPLPKSLQQPLPSPLNVPHGEDIVPGWWKTETPQTTLEQRREDRLRHQMDLQNQLRIQRGYDRIESDTDLPKMSPFPQLRKIADVENSIEALAQKHGVEGSKMKDIILDVLKHPMDYISPMPGELGMARPKGTNPGSTILRDLIKQGKTLKDIGDQYNVSAPAVLGWLRKFGISPNKRGVPVKGTIKEIFERLDKGETQASIAKDLGYSAPSALSNRLNREGLTNLTAEEWRDLREFYKNQFEGAPTDPEMILDSAKKYILDKDIPQFRRGANDNKPLHPSQGKDPFQEPFEEQSHNEWWNKFMKGHDTFEEAADAARKRMDKDLSDFAAKDKRDWIRATNDKKSMNLTWQEADKLSEKAGYKSTVEWAVDQSKGKKTVILGGGFYGGDEKFIYHDGRLLREPRK